MGCGAWTGYGIQKHCLDCKRTLGVKPLVPCGYPGCVQTFKPNSGAKYCFEHKGLRVKKAAA